MFATQSNRKRVANRFLFSVVALAIGLIAGQAVEAQEWARKMFKVTEHDFGSVAKGSKQEFAFELENVYEEPIHIAAVQTSCGCTSPTITKADLNTWEKSSIVAAFNTRTFLGQRSATITVTIDKPFYAEVQLQVRGYIRSDVVFTPGHIDFGSVDAGTAVSKKVQIAYAGRSDWKIQDVLSANPNLEVELSEAQRSAGRVAYDMTVHLLPEASEGFVQDRLLIVTDDPRMAKIPIYFEAHVSPSLTVSPSPLSLGDVEISGEATGRLIVKAKQPFKITKIHCDAPGFEIKQPEVASKVHVLPVTFKAGSSASRVTTTVEIETDLNRGTQTAGAQTTGAKVKCRVSVNVGRSEESTGSTPRVAERE